MKHLQVNKGSFKFERKSCRFPNWKIMRRSFCSKEATFNKFYHKKLNQRVKERSSKQWFLISRWMSYRTSIRSGGDFMKLNLRNKPVVWSALQGTFLSTKFNPLYLQNLSLWFNLSQQSFSYQARWGAKMSNLLSNLSITSELTCTTLLLLA